MGKRMSALLLVLAVVACAAIGLAACNEGEKTPAELTISQVNNVKSAPSAEILALKAEAEWC